MPTPFKTFVNRKPTSIADVALEKTERNLVSMVNNSSIATLFSQNDHKFDLMYAKRAYVHWYVGGSMEEG